ncbi:putative uncharacterized protein [Odoribacter splanchnicus CAG:14]|nr:putative uncharacterized protein [Odoribacter splanchnicus CAG:14]
MKRLIYFILGLLVASCYDDKGNYTYQEVNTLDVSLIKYIRCVWIKIRRLQLYRNCLSPYKKMRIIWNIRGCIRQPIIIFTDMASSTRLDWKRI